MLPELIFSCLLFAVFLLWLSGRQRQKSGLPGGRIVSSDTSKWNALEKSLYSPALGLTGKPDYILEQAGEIIPVEVKSSSDPDRGPYDSHVYQLAAYCLLIMNVYGKRPAYGILHYTSKSGKQRTYSIPFTHQLEVETTALIQEIQNRSLRVEADRSHQLASRCVHCGYRHSCDQALG